MKKSPRGLLAASRTLSDGDASDESGAAGDAGLKDFGAIGTKV